MAKKEKAEKKEKKVKKVKKAEAGEAESSGGSKLKGLLVKILLLVVGAGLIAVAGYFVGNRLLGAMQAPDPTVVVLPTVYTVGDESIPALSIPAGTELLYKVEKAGEEEEEEEEEGEEPKEDEESDKEEEPKEDGESDGEGEPQESEAQPQQSEAPSTMDTYIYTYSKITSTDALAADYLTMLAEEHNFVPVDEELNELEALPELPTETGAVHLAREPLEGDWLFSVQFSWDAESCTVTVGPLEGSIEYIPVEGMSAFEALDYVAALGPAVLGLPEDPNANYKYYLINGVVMAEGIPCVHINVYGDHPEAGTNMLMGSYLVSSDGTRLYALDEVSKTITELQLP